MLNLEIAIGTIGTMGTEMSFRVLHHDRTVLDVATEMTNKRTDAALLTRRGRIVGIVTDHHFTL